MENISSNNIINQYFTNYYKHINKYCDSLCECNLSHNQLIEYFNIYGVNELYDPWLFIKYSNIFSQNLTDILWNKINVHTFFSSNYRYTILINLYKSMNIKIGEYIFKSDPKEWLNLYLHLHMYLSCFQEKDSLSNYFINILYLNSNHKKYEYQSLSLIHREINMNYTKTQNTIHMQKKCSIGFKSKHINLPIDILNIIQDYCGIFD